MAQNIHNAIEPGSVLNGKNFRYRIIKVLGQGSFGITYLALVKIKGEFGEIETYVALKEFFMRDINGRENSNVTSSSDDGIFDKYKKKFITEAKRLGQLKHPNIIKVIESFEANNTIYYAMEYVDGGSLDDHIREQGPLPESAVVDIALQISDALKHMHSRNMLHLDLKPSNIMMRLGQPVLIDFGLAKQYDENGDPESSTSIGGGTPGYAPLEQSSYQGSDHGSFPVTMDIYALGGTMYKMLTGKKPPVAADILNHGFPEYELTAHNISREMVAMIKYFMQPIWKDRPQNDVQVQAELERLSTDCESTQIKQQVTRPSRADVPRVAVKRPQTTAKPKTASKFNKKVVFGAIGGLVVLGGGAFLLSKAFSESSMTADELFENGIRYEKSYAESDSIEYANKAVEYYEEAIEQGHVGAMKNLARMYDNYPALDKKSEAVKLYKSAAKAGDGESALSLAYIYMIGDNEWPESLKYVNTWIENANGKDYGFKGLSECYGYGVNRDFDQSYTWARSALAQNPEARPLIGFMFEHGLGVTANRDSAYYYYDGFPELRANVAPKTPNAPKKDNTSKKTQSKSQPSKPQPDYSKKMPDNSNRDQVPAQDATIPKNTAKIRKEPIKNEVSSDEERITNNKTK